MHRTEVDIAAERSEIALAQADPQRFASLYDRYYEPILQFVYRRVSDKDEAYDVTAEVFLKALLHIGKYRFMGLPFSAWLYRIAINEVNRAFRSQKARPVISLDEDIARRLQEELKTGEDERLERLIRALKQLKQEQYMLIELRFFEERSFQEVAEILGSTEDSVKVRTYRVLDKIRTLMLKTHTL